MFTGHISFCAAQFPLVSEPYSGVTLKKIFYTDLPVQDERADFLASNKQGDPSSGEQNLAFVILSAGALTRSKPRTLSLRAVGLASVGLALLVLGVGVAIGHRVAGGDFSMSFVKKPDFEIHSEAVPVEPAEPPLAFDGNLLINRFGELSGRMSQLEAEARELANRVEEIKGVADADDAELQGGRVARTPPGSPAGGPLLSPRNRAESDSGARPEHIDGSLSWLEKEIERVAGLMEEVDREVLALNIAHMARPGREPVRGHKQTSAFGTRIDPFTKRRAFHSGVDFPAPTGTPIYASAGGRVIYAGWRRAYGNTVEVDHGDGLVTRYAHASKLLVKKGQVVMPGEQIAKVGSTGRSTGAHLHFEILRDGRFVNPKAYLAQF